MASQSRTQDSRRGHSYIVGAAFTPSAGMQVLFPLLQSRDSDVLVLALFSVLTKGEFSGSTQLEPYISRHHHPSHHPKYLVQM